MAFERVLAKLPKTEVPDGAQCYICLDGGDDLLRECACRGASAGFAHCLAEMAARNAAMTSEGRRLLNRWTDCATCQQSFTGALDVEMSRRCWRRFRDAPRDKRKALGSVAIGLRDRDENDAADRLEEEAHRSLRRDDPRVLFLEIRRAASIMKTNVTAALEILTTRLRPRIAQCTNGAFREEYARNMARILDKLGRSQDGHKFAAENVELAVAHYGPESSMTLTSKRMHAALLILVGRVDEGIAILEQVHATRVLGADHCDTRDTKHMLDGVSAP